MRKGILLFLFILTLSGCAPAPAENQETAAPLLERLPSETAAPLSISREYAAELNLPRRANILYFDSEQVIYYIDEWAADGEYLDLHLYKYSFMEDAHIEAAAYSEFLCFTGDVSLSGDKFYMAASFYGGKM